MFAEGESPKILLGVGASVEELLEAGFRAKALLGAEVSAKELLDAGATVYDLAHAGLKIPKLERPYTRLWEDIQKQARLHDQGTFGPSRPTPEPNVCNTAMCTAGHLVNMAGDDGWKLQSAYGFCSAAQMLHEVAHPGWPCQDFSSIPQSWAMAYIETMAQREAQEEVENAK